MCQPHYSPGKVVRAYHPQCGPVGPYSVIKQQLGSPVRAWDRNRGALTIVWHICPVEEMPDVPCYVPGPGRAGSRHSHGTCTVGPSRASAPVSYLQLPSIISCYGSNLAVRQTWAPLRRHAKRQVLLPFQEICCVKTPARLTPVQPTRHQYLPARVLEQRGICSLSYQPYSLG